MDTNSPAPAAAPVEERFIPQHPTVDPLPERTAPADPVLCGNCPGWHQQNRRFPFGQCLPARAALGAVMYTPELSGCTLPLADKEKGAR